VAAAAPAQIHPWQLGDSSHALASYHGSLKASPRGATRPRSGAQRGTGSNLHRPRRLFPEEDVDCVLHGTSTDGQLQLEVALPVGFGAQTAEQTRAQGERLKTTVEEFAVLFPAAGARSLGRLYSDVGRLSGSQQSEVVTKGVGRHAPL
jgi:hypothetical protein